MGSVVPDYEYLLENPYDSFMRKHLQHYGYYTGRNELFRRKYSSNSIVGLDDVEYINAALQGEERADVSDRLFDTSYLKTNQLASNDGTGKLQLKTPRELFVGSGPSTLQEPKWPIEMEVLPNKVHHLTTPPELEKLEPFYEPSGFEQMPMARGEDSPASRVVFAYEPPFNPFFIRSRVGGSRVGCSAVNAPLTSSDDATLQFESRFECGNLEKAIQIGPYEYELYLRTDLYTTKHTQWFYFRVQNMRVNRVYRFTIVNFYKSESLYNQGMRPLMYSEKIAKLQGLGWRRWGNSIKYYKNNLKYTNCKGDFSYYSLTWCCSFPHESDTVYFAHCYPYTYSDLQHYLHGVIEDPDKSQYCKLRVLCNSLAGNNVYVLNVTEPIVSEEEENLKKEKYKQRKLVIVSARVHPGETNASWMMKGFLDYILSSSPDAKVLREHFFFKIIPMLNPDGVIVGNYRCGLAGRDLNRNYKTMLKDSFPTVWNTRNMVERLVEDNRPILLYCDLHGHSRKNNVFIYGCENKDNLEMRFREQIFPAMLAKNAPSKFDFPSCRFSVQKSKEGTGRIVMWRLGITNSFTMEATFCGSSLGERNKTHFSQRDFESMGYHLCDTLLDYFDPDPIKTRFIFSEIEVWKKQEFLKKLRMRGIEVDPNRISLSELAAMSGEEKAASSSDDGDGSDSSDSDGLPVHYEYLAKQIEGKQKQRKSIRERANQRNFDKAIAANCKQKRSESANSKSFQSNGDTAVASTILNPISQTPLVKPPRPFARRAPPPSLTRHEPSPIASFTTSQPSQPNTVSLGGQDLLPRVTESTPVINNTSNKIAQRTDPQVTIPWRCSAAKVLDRPYQTNANRTYLKYSVASRMPLQAHRGKNFSVSEERSDARLLQSQSDSSKDSYICPHHQRQLATTAELSGVQESFPDTDLTLESLVLARPGLCRTPTGGLNREDDYRRDLVSAKHSIVSTVCDYNVIQEAFRIESLPIRQLSAKRESIKELRNTSSSYITGRKKSLVSPQLNTPLPQPAVPQDSVNGFDTSLEQEIHRERGRIVFTEGEDCLQREETNAEIGEATLIVPSQCENASHTNNASSVEQARSSPFFKTMKSVAFSPSLSDDTTANGSSSTGAAATQPTITSLPVPLTSSQQSSCYQLEEFTSITPSPITRSKTFHSASSSSPNLLSLGAVSVKVKPYIGKSAPPSRTTMSSVNIPDTSSPNAKVGSVTSADVPRRCYLNGMDAPQQYNSPTKVVLVMSAVRNPLSRGERPLGRRMYPSDILPNTRRG